MYTIIRYITGTLVAAVFAANCIATILVGILPRDPDAYHGYVIFSLISGIVVSAVTGVFGYISIVPNAICHHPDNGRYVLDFWGAITATVTCGAMYFWLATLVGLIARHREVIPIGVVAGMYTVGMIIGIFRTLSIYRR